MTRLPPALLLTIAALLPAVAPAAAQTPAPTSFGDAPGALRLPEAVAVAPDGTVLVGDHFSGRVQAFRGGAPVAEASFGLRGEVCGRLGSVSGLTRAADGRVYVFDSDNQRVQVFGADGVVQRCWGSRGRGRGQFMTSSGAYAASTGEGGIAVDGRHVYVADTGNDRVQRFTRDGGAATVLAKGRVRQPQGLAVRGRRLLVADDGNHRVVELDAASGRVVRATRNAGSFRLRFPYDVAIAPNGHAYVADNNGHRIVVLDRRLRQVRAWGSYGRARGQLVYPRAIALAPNGNVVVADPGNDRVTEYTARGRYVRTLGVGGRAVGRVTAPLDVTANGRGEVVVADGAARLSWFALEGGRWLGRWAQGRSFQDSTATVPLPQSVAFAGEDRVRVAASGQVRQYGAGEARVIVGTPLGEAQKFGGGGKRGARPLSPRTIARAADGTTWALDLEGRFAKLGADGAPGPLLGEEDPEDRTSTDLAVLTDGSVAIAQGGRENAPNPREGTILRYDAAGRRLATWTLPRPAAAPEPAVPGGEAGRVPASRPGGIASDGAGGAWVSDAAHGRVVRFDANGAVIATLGAPGTGAGQLAAPRGLALACDGSLLVADTGNNRIVRFPSAGAATGCAPLPAPVTALARVPKPVGVKLRARDRAAKPARTLARIAVTCARECRLDARGVGSAFAGRGSTPLDVRARLSGGRTITLTASDAVLATMRRALRRGGQATAAVTVVATAPDGVQDVDTLTFTFRGRR